MIPDELLRKAAEAAVNAPVYDDEPPRARLADMHPDDVQAWLNTTRAALEAVAHIIWNQGWEAGMSYVVSLERGYDDDENVTNPYERNETT